MRLLFVCFLVIFPFVADAQVEYLWLGSASDILRIDGESLSWTNIGTDDREVGSCLSDADSLLFCFFADNVRDPDFDKIDLNLPLNSAAGLILESQSRSDYLLAYLKPLQNPAIGDIYKLEGQFYNPFTKEVNNVIWDTDTPLGGTAFDYVAHPCGGYWLFNKSRLSNTIYSTKVTSDFTITEDVIVSNGNEDVFISSTTKANSIFVSEYGTTAISIEQSQNKRTIELLKFDVLSGVFSDGISLPPEASIVVDNRKLLLSFNGEYLYTIEEIDEEYYQYCKYNLVDWNLNSILDSREVLLSLEVSLFAEFGLPMLRNLRGDRILFATDQSFALLSNASNTTSTISYPEIITTSANRSSGSNNRFRPAYSGRTENINVLPMDTSLCELSDISLDLNQSYDSIIWNDSRLAPSIVAPLREGWNDIVLYDDLCLYTDSINVDLLPPVDSITEISICAGDTLSWMGHVITQTGIYIDTLDADCLEIYTLDVDFIPTVYSDTLQLQLGQKLQGVTYNESGIHTQSTTSTITNCDSIIIINVVQEDSLSDISQANSFTPNGDNINDTWKVSLPEENQLIECIIYNRWGNPVFHTSSSSVEWDGTIAGQETTPGVYFYYFTYETPTGEVATKGGDITVLN